MEQPSKQQDDTTPMEGTSDEDTATKSGRKRLRNEIQDLHLSGASPPHLALQRLRLEAIFHPKFDNEARNNVDSDSIRTLMKQRVHSHKGYLEVSLKHSGSLLLWSGGQRYYSKNATDNLYTHVGEVLLRQHFCRAWWGETNEQQQYLECSEFVEKHRLTLAFEVVTSVLGHHGELPNRDFLILTAIADRQHERFYTTEELLQFCQQYRLPHNDFWAFFEDASVDRLFHLYDTTRETGMAKDTVEALNKAADAHVSSIYPHVDFQGNLLEGLVIRYVASGASSSEGQHLDTWNRLAEAASQILKTVPPSSPPCFELAKEMSMNETKLPSVLTTDIRTLSNLQDDIRTMLVDSDGDNRRTVERHAEIDVLHLVRQLPLDQNLDEETRRIAQLIMTLDNLKVRVNYGVAKEVSLDHPERWLCTIHIVFDATHKKFRARREEGGMELFRGFTIELDCNDQTGKSSNDVKETSSQAAIPNASSADDDSLMLKMKFLPYMVRTFGCRNGLPVIKTKGPAAFSEYTMNLMKRWGISNASILKWQPFFTAWGVYAKSCFDGGPVDETSTQLPELTEANYLDHLKHFTTLYEAGKIKGAQAPSSSTSTFRGTVVVASLSKTTADAVADFVADVLGGLRRCENLKKLTVHDLTTACAPTGGGLICSASIDEGVKNVRGHLKTHSDSIFLVLYGCEDERIDSDFFQDTEENRKKLKGEARSWRKTHCKVVVELPESSLEAMDEGASKFRTSSEFDDAVKLLENASSAVPVADTRPGLLVFFPGIPGSGKSALSSSQTKEQLDKIVEDSSVGFSRARKVCVLVGDETKKKYWPHVSEVRGKDPSSIVIADKNAPPSAWGSVGSACSKSSGVAVPVFPDGAALTTTSIAGVRFPDGSIQERRHCYPFSLHYLAVCIARILARQHGSHAGKLDSGTDTACMVVVKFFALYRKLTAEDLFESIQVGVNAAMSPSPIRVPFFAASSLPMLPDELEATLRQALQVQYGCELVERDSGSNGADTIQDMEKQLRKVIEEHSSMLLSLAADEGVSRDAFAAEIAKRISELPTDPYALPLTEVSDPIVLASVDVKVEEVHNIIRANRGCLKEFLGQVLPNDDVDANLPTGRFHGDRFIADTHITMAHMSEISQADLTKSFGQLIGAVVEVTVTGLLYAEHIAALEVQVANQTSDDTPRSVQACKNAFPHITLWRKEGVESFQSNDLPGLVAKGDATRVRFEHPATLRGEISFWGRDRSDPKGPPK